MRRKNGILSVVASQPTRPKFGWESVFVTYFLIDVFERMEC